jgi:copper binding plastocyanin/azurin family protein
MPARLAVAITFLVALLVPASAGADNPTLDAFVGANDAFSIRLQDSTGALVTHLATGTYTIKVHDLSEIHNFHLTGPGVDMATAVGAKEEVTWTVTLTDGTYQYHCDPHASVMHGSFTVGNVTAPPPAVKLKGSVGPGRRISLRYAGGDKVTVIAGADSVTLTVDDRSKTDNFHLTGPGVNKSTGVRFHGRVTWKVSIAPGKYLYRSDRHKKLRGSFIVSSADYPA